MKNEMEKKRKRKEEARNGLPAELISAATLKSTTLRISRSQMEEDIAYVFFALAFIPKPPLY